MKKSNALINRCHYFPSKKNSNIDSNTESVKKTFAEISQRMFSEIMPAFTEMTEMFIMKIKNSEKRALFSINYILLRCVVNRRQSRELEKHQEKNYFRR